MEFGFRIYRCKVLRCFGVSGLWFRVLGCWGLGFRVWGVGFCGLRV